MHDHKNERNIHRAENPYQEEGSDELSERVSRAYG